MRRIIVLLCAVALVSIVVPARASSCSTTNPDDNNRQQCAPYGCTLTQTTPCKLTRKVDAPAAGRYEAGFDLGYQNLNDQNAFIGYCRNNAVSSGGTACELITPSEAQALATSEAGCLAAYNPTTTPATKCIPNDPDPDGHNVGRWGRIARRSFATGNPVRCLYLSDDTGLVAQPNHEGKIGYVFEQNIPAGGPSSTAISWVGRYFKLYVSDANGNAIASDADFDGYWYAYLGSTACANELSTFGTEPEPPTADPRDSVFSISGNEHGYIPACTSTVPTVSNCLGANSRAIVNGQAWYSIEIQMFSGRPLQYFTFVICPTSSPC